MARRKLLRPKLFIGSSSKSKSLGYAYAIQEGLEEDAEVTVWKQGVFKLTKPTLDSLVDELRQTDFAVFVFAPDDAILLGREKRGTVRDNVVFELGLFMGKLGRERVFAVAPKGHKLRIPTDLIGITLGSFVPDREDKNLKAAFGPFCNQVRLQVGKLGALKPPAALPSARRGRQPSGRLLIFDAVADFSIDKNPTGPWSYGYAANLDGPFALHMTKQPGLSQGRLDRWSSPALGKDIAVMRNKAKSTIPGDPPTYDIPHDVIHMHPGESGTFDVVRWTCPKKGQYSIVGDFCGLDHGAAADVDVHVRKNLGVSLFSDILRGALTQTSFALNENLRKDDTLDFIVGVGPSGKHWSDSTGLRAKVTQKGR